MQAQSKLVHDKLEISVEYITPEKAAHWLTFNKKNRPLRRGHLADLVHQMQIGAWEINGDTIRFDSEGNMADGQHRCTAVVQSGVAIESIVVKHLPESAFSTIDRNARRNAADYLGMKQIPNANLIAATARLVWLWERTGGVTNNVINITPKDTAEIVCEKYPDILDVASWYGTINNKSLFNGSEICFVKTIFDRINQKKSQIFFEQLTTGLGVNEFSSSFHLRNKLIEERASSRKISKHIRIGFYFLALKNFFAGKSTKILRITTQGESPTNLKELFDISGVK